MKNASRRLFIYLMRKLDDEPISARAVLCDDIAEFFPNDSMAERLREQARTLRRIDQEAEVIRLALVTPCHEDIPLANN